MELTPQKNDVLKVRRSGTAFLCRRFIWSERSSGECAVGRSSGALRHLSDAQERNRHYLVRPGAGAGLCRLTAPTAKTITLERRDAWQSTSSQTAVYVLPAKDGQFRILSPICPHLGCSVRWVDDENKFVCPCHAGSFTATGERIAGPPPRSMDSLESKVEDGVLKVRYQYFRQLVPNKEVMA